MTSKRVTRTWKAWVLAGLVMMAISWATLSPWMVGPAISLLLTAGAATLIAAWLNVGLEKFLKPQPTKSCTTPPMTPGGLWPVDSPSKVESLTLWSQPHYLTKTGSHLASIRLASNTLKRLNQSKRLKTRRMTLASTLRKSYGNSLLCTLEHMQSRMLRSHSSFGTTLKSFCERKRSIRSSRWRPIYCLSSLNSPVKG